jgi:hypothetical protein
MKLSTKASLCSALFLALMNLPTAQACGDPPSHIPFLILMTWPPVAASMAISIPLALWHENKLRKKIVGMLRDGTCINDTKRIIARARVTSVLLMLSLAIVSPYVMGWTMQLLRANDIEQSNKFWAAYYEVAMVPERIAEQWLGEPSFARLNHIID